MRKPAPTYALDLVFHPEHDDEYVHFENSGSCPFQPRPVDLPRVNAWWMAEAALLTYWDPSEAGPIFHQAGLSADFKAPLLKTSRPERHTA